MMASLRTMGGAVLNPIVQALNTFPAVTSSAATADERVPDLIASCLPAKETLQAGGRDAAERETKTHKSPTNVVEVDVDVGHSLTGGGEAEQSISVSSIMQTRVMAPTTEIDMTHAIPLQSLLATHTVVHGSRIKVMAHTFDELAAIAAGDMPRAPPPPPPPLPALPPPPLAEEEEEEGKESTTGKLLGQRSATRKVRSGCMCISLRLFIRIHKYKLQVIRLLPKVGSTSGTRASGADRVSPCPPTAAE